jgi:succinyl-diaminopimelate desuccinylase
LDADDAMRERAQELLDEAGLIATAQALVRIRSVYDPALPDGNERAAADFVDALLTEWQLPIVRREVAPGRPNLVVDLVGDRPGPILILEGHTDVVTAGDRAVWNSDPFSGDIRDGKLFGRGSTDMKGGLAAILHAARAIQRAGRDFAGTLRLAILADEEGLMLGAKGFVADGYVQGAAAAITAEPESDRICLAQKGALRLRVTLRGRMAHGCMPEEGANPVVAAGEVIVACRQLEAVIQAERPRHPLLGAFYLTPTVALMGEREQGNVIPASADIFLDIRTTSEHEHGDIRRRVAAAIAEAAASVAGVEHEIEVVDDRAATETAPDEPIVQALVDAQRALTGREPEFGGVPGTTDLTIFWAATQLPVIAYGPGTVTLAHQADEFVLVDDLVRYARVYIDTALRYFARMERG